MNQISHIFNQIVLLDLRQFGTLVVLERLLEGEEAGQF